MGCGLASKRVHTKEYYEYGPNAKLILGCFFFLVCPGIPGTPVGSAHVLRDCLDSRIGTGIFSFFFQLGFDTLFSNFLEDNGGLRMFYTSDSFYVDFDKKRRFDFESLFLELMNRVFGYSICWALKWLQFYLDLCSDDMC